MSSNPYSDSAGVSMCRLEGLLESKSIEQLLPLLENPSFQNNLKSDPTAISVVSEYLTKETYSSNLELYEYCEKLMYLMAELRNPDESIFDFIEQAEDRDEIKFCVMLKTLKITLQKMSKKNRYYSVKWCYQTIIQHIEDMPKIEDFKLEEDEVVLQDNAEASLSTENVYNEVIKFCEPIICEISMLPLGSVEEDVELFKSCTLIFLFKLLGRPLVYMNLESNNSKTNCRILAEGLLKYIAEFKMDFMYFLNCISPYKTELTKETSMDSVFEKDYCNISLGMFYYLIIGENEHYDMVSQVYHPLFIVEMITNVVLDMLKMEHSRARHKALKLYDVVLERISERSLNFLQRNCTPYGKLMEVLAKIMVFAEVKEIRQLALKVFKLLLLKFDIAGRYMILLNIPTVVTQPGFVGFVTTLVKDFIHKALSEKDPKELEFFGSKKCVVILKKFCHLPHREQSDLIELSDQIISSLNLVRFIFLIDKENSTGLVEVIPYLEKHFLDPLQSGLQLSVAHYKLQLREIATAAPNEKVSVKVAGEELPNLPPEQKTRVLNVAINTFDLIESLLARVRECIEEFKQGVVM